MLKPFFRLFACLLLTHVFFSIFLTPAFAASQPVQVSTRVLSGPLTATASAPQNIKRVSENTTTYTLPIQLTDLTGSGSGWRLSITPSSETTISALQVACLHGTTCSDSNALPATPMLLASGSPTQILASAPDAGMGLFLVQLQITTSLPINTPLDPPNIMLCSGV